MGTYTWHRLFKPDVLEDAGFEDGDDDIEIEVRMGD
jgi:hypothetical protein